MISYMISRLVIHVFGTLYPAYSSYKTVRTKNVKGYVQWMKYWIVFAFLCCVEPFCDFFLGSWAPFYYESKILMVAWLICPATRGYNYLYRTFVHPTLMDNEEYIDHFLNNIKEQWRQAVFQLGKRGSAIMVQTMLQGVLSRTSFGSCLSRSSSFTDQTFGYAEIDERAIAYDHQHALIRTLILSGNRRNSDPTLFRKLQDSYSENARCVQLRGDRGVAGFESVRFMDDDGATLSARDLGEGVKVSYRAPRDKMSSSLETLEEFDERRIESLPPLINHRLALLAEKLSSEGLTEDHIGVVVSTLTGTSTLDLNPNPSYQYSSDETESALRSGESEVSVTEETPELQNQELIEEHCPDDKVMKDESGSEVKEISEKSLTSDSKQSRAGRYRKLPAPSPPDSKKIDNQSE